MIFDLVRKHAPEWIEVSVVVGTLVLGAAATGGIMYYKLDQVFEEVQEIKYTLRVVPVVVERVDQLERRTTDIEEDLEQLEERLYHLRKEVKDAG